ncbi:putative teichuronic acid biosynthesis glycosyltransferase TuaC [bacterium BMS3Abin14]|nr:putative teichuronic acid biosynthesis glycosyltransferase TuaC [bacterium BMS3Abin14]
MPSIGKLDPTDDRIGVLHIISGLTVGGAERMLVWMARYHDRSRFRVGVVSLMSGGGFAHAIRCEDVPVFELGQRRGRLSVSGLRSLFSIAKEFDPEVLQGHMFHSNILARLMGVRLIGLSGRELHVLNTIHHEHESIFRRLACSVTGPMAAAEIVFSLPSDNLVAPEFFWRPTREVFPYGVEINEELKRDRRVLRAALDIPDDAVVWVSVGRLIPEKGFPVLIEAFGLMKTRGERPFLLIVGDGPERERISSAISRTGLSGSVSLLGIREDVEDIYRASDFFVLSSLSERSPLAVLEAMAAGLPVVATRVGNVPGMVEEGRTGFIVPPSDPSALAGAMERVMKMGEEAREWGKRGSRRVHEFFDFRRTQEKIEEYYRLLSRGKGRNG